MKILVINGPNINMLGVREPEIYGKEDFCALLSLLENTANLLGIEIDQFQSNHEGAIIDQIQQAYSNYDALIINPAAYTHTSIAILDALKAVSLPCVEVHISNIEQREEFRRISYTSLACEKVIAGLGIDGYRQAIYYLKDKYSN